MKIIEQGHCGGSEQKEGKWPWRHNAGETTGLPQRAHVSAENRHARFPSERQLRAAATGVRRLTAQGFCPEVYPEQCLCSDVEGASEGLMNILLMRPRPVAKISSHLKRLLLRPRFVVNRGSRSPNSSLLPGKEIFDSYLYDRHGVQKWITPEGAFKRLSTHTLSPLHTVCWHQAGTNRLSARERKNP